MRFDLTLWPDIDMNAVPAAFPEVPLEAYPDLAGYSRAGIHEGLMGQGGLFFASDMARLLKLRPGLRLLDLGCGAGATSLFLAKQFGVTVYAVDAGMTDDLRWRAAAAGVGHLIVPLRADAKNLPFPAEFFDAIFTMNSFFYYGTDDLYPSYLLGFLRPGGEFVLGNPCYREELTPDVPEEFLIEFPACLAVHSPDWWRKHFENTRQVATVRSALHPCGVEFWTDRVRFLLEEQPPREMPAWKRDMVHAMIRLLNRDHDGFVSHFMLYARRKLTEGSYH